MGGSPSFADPFQDVAGRPGLSEPNRFPYAFPTPGQPINFSQFVPYDLSTISPQYDVPYAFNLMLQAEREFPGNPGAHRRLCRFARPPSGAGL